MKILALALYGSYARGDQHENSDIDLFAITDSESYKYKSVGKTNISYYPLSIATERCKDGDVFFLHIIKESQPLHDPNNLISKLTNTFQYKDNYSKEICKAADMAWVLIRHKSLFKDYKKYNARLAWCLRTIIISKAAESKIAIFSASDLGEFSKNKNVEVSINNRIQEPQNDLLIKTTESILKNLNAPVPNVKQKPFAILTYFIKTENTFGRKMIFEHFYKNHTAKDDYA